ncbi:MAG: formylmethanofuran dehydrogenase subunit B [Planctomycetales bacterium]|nr:formylmethanofuran dehydrogenase subunit B [Planctomycetales bacterium]
MAESAKSIGDCACTVCGCVCDDLTFHVKGNRLQRVEPSCPLADPWFDQLAQSDPPEACIEGAPVGYDTAITRAVEILSGSRAPLIFGLSRSSTGGQRAAVSLAERLGASIDTTASVCHGPSIVAIQQVGESTSTLGEVRHRADLVLFWGANPAVSHPRHFERYSLHPHGQFLPDSSHGRTVVVIDTKATETSKRADRFLCIPADADFDLIWALRARLRGIDIPADVIPGLAAEDFEWLAHTLSSCTYGAVFFGLGLAQRGIGHANVTALLSLVDDLNDHTRFTARRLRIPGDVTGADLVLCWQTGFPFAVNLARGYPRYNPGEYSANDLLRRGEVDACLFVGSSAVADLSAAAQRRVGELPTVVLDYPHQQPGWTPTVQLTTAVYGVHAPGTVYRMDEVPLPTRAVITGRYRTDEQILKAITEGVVRPS